MIDLHDRISNTAYDTKWKIMETGGQSICNEEHNWMHNDEELSILWTVVTLWGEIKERATRSRF